MAVGVSGMGPVSLMDADHRPVRPAIYEVDTRSVAEIDE